MNSPEIVINYIVLRLYNPIMSKKIPKVLGIGIVIKVNPAESFIQFKIIL